jgi:hypothetical protein
MMQREPTKKPLLGNIYPISNPKEEAKKTVIVVIIKKKIMPSFI